MDLVNAGPVSWYGMEWLGGDSMLIIKLSCSGLCFIKLSENLYTSMKLGT